MKKKSAMTKLRTDNPIALVMVLRLHAKWNEFKKKKQIQK